MPVVFHTGYEEFYDLSLPPETMEEVARLFPTLPVVFARSLFPRFDDAWRIATPNTPIPYSPPLEDAFLPGPERIAAEIRRRLR